MPPVIVNPNPPSQLANFEHLIVGDASKKQSGRVTILGKDGTPIMIFHGGGGSITSVQDSEPSIRTKADIRLYTANSNLDNPIVMGTTVRLLASSGDILVGGNGTDGDVLLFPKSVNNTDPNKSTVHLAGQGGVLYAGGNGVHGSVLLFKANATNNHDPNQASIRLDGAAGDIILQNADCAEEFDIAADAAQVEPGTVMVMDDDGALRPSEEAFDRRVAGVISGAGDYKPGIVLDRQYSAGRRLPIALVGKVFCKVDADQGPIQVGDLLTTSPTPGHAMKASDPLKAFGAVLGKALRPLQSGQGLIPVLVALQ